ncbi:MAG TPA: Rrf2 family transcriptional regulator [Chitinophagales bacterium]|nr:Rrf2 family transcriptional regulator [Chitinophagales bacterium]
MLSKKAKYGLKAVLYLARNYENAESTVIVAELSQQEYIPRKFLEKILLELKKSDILQSRMGRHGGYTLSREPDKIFMGEIVRVLDGPIGPLACVSERAYVPCYDCKDEHTCEIRKVMKLVRDATVSILDKTSLQDALHQNFRVLQYIA